MKKILSFVLALLMSASAASFVGAAEEAAIAAEDTAVVAGTTAAISEAEAEARAQHADALALLDAWDILHGKSKDNPAAADLIQRYEMALFVSRISTGWTDDTKWAVADQWYDRDHDTSGFDDLEGTPAINYLGALSYASQKGIILGYGNKKFGPSDGITYQDALTMIVRTLGYYNLSWPWGNIEKAVTLGLTVGIPKTVKYTDILNRGQVAQIIYNALFATTKDGDTLAARNFNGDLDWKSIIITVAGKKGYFLTLEDKDLYLPGAKLLEDEQKLGFKVVNKDGTLSEQTYYVKTNQIPNLGFTDRLENYLGFAYKALFSKDADSNYVTLEWLKPVQDDFVKNWGDKSVKGEFPIYDYVKGLNLRSKFAYAGNTYLNDWNGNYGWKEIIVMDALQGKATIQVDDVDSTRYGIDWSANGKGNIVERVVVAHPKDADYEAKKAEAKKLGLSMVAKPEDADYAVKIGDKTVCFNIEWHWNDAINAYFKYVYKDVDTNTKELVGIDILDPKDVEEMMKNRIVQKDEATKRGLIQITDDELAWAKTAYAYLIPFTLNDAGSPNYGLFEEFRLGQWFNVDDACSSHSGAQKGFEIKKLDAVSINAAKLFSEKKYNDKDFMNLYNTDWAKTTAAKGIYENMCADGFYWVNDAYGLKAPEDKTFIIYSVDEGTGEIKIVKYIYDRGHEKADNDNYVTTGVVRGFDVAKRSVIIGDTEYFWDYNCLADCGLVLEKPDKKELRAEFTYFFKTLFNQYVTYVICDGKLVHIELTGASSELIIVDSYAGLSSDNYIVVNGYDTKDLQYRQFRIGSYNGWVKGDYYYYSDQANEDLAFARGTLYKINSYDESKDVYYVSTLANRFGSGATSQRYDLDALVANGVTGKAPTEILLKAGYKKIGNDDWKKAGSSDKYVLICNPVSSTVSSPLGIYGYNGDYAPIIVYVGKGPENPAAQWAAKGYLVNGVGAKVLLGVDFNAVVGFNADQYDISYVLFQTYEYDYAAYDSAYADGWYLLGASSYTALCFNFYTGEVEPFTAVNKNLKRGFAYPAINGVIVSDEERYDANTLTTAIKAAYQSNSRFVFGDGLLKNYTKDNKPILWNTDEVSMQILSSVIPSAAALGSKVKGLTSGTSVYLVSTERQLDYRPNDSVNASIRHKLITDVEKFESLSEFLTYVDDHGFGWGDIYFWYIHTIDGKTVFYMEDLGKIEDDGPDGAKKDFKDALVVESKIDNDTAVIKGSAQVVTTKQDGIPTAFNLKNMTFYFADNPDDPHGFTISGEDHNAIYLDSFEFGSKHECTENNWDTQVIKDADPVYKRAVGMLKTEVFAPHAEEGGCDMIKGVKFNIPNGELNFPVITQTVATVSGGADPYCLVLGEVVPEIGSHKATTMFNVTFEDIDRDGNKETYEFEVEVTVYVKYKADVVNYSVYDRTDIEFRFKSITNQKAGDNAVTGIKVW